MGIKSIDICLLPERKERERIIKISKKVRCPNSKIILNKKNFLPHVTLFIGNIEKENLKNVKKEVKKISKKYKKMHLDAFLKTKSFKEGEKLIEFKLEKTKQLENLHKELIYKFRGIVKTPATKEMLFNSNEAKGLTLKWIDDYFENSTIKKFSPHITLGTRNTDIKEFKTKIKIDKVAICPLGRYCTCRKILFKRKLSS